MKRMYQQPQVNYVLLNAEDVITTSDKDVYIDASRIFAINETIESIEQ